MTSSQFQYDDLLSSFGLQRGVADNVRWIVRSASLQGVSTIDFEPTGVTAIVGANNSGKSTLLTQLGDELINPGASPQPSLVSFVGSDLSGDQNDIVDWLCRHASISETPQPTYGANGPAFVRMGQQIPLATLRDSFQQTLGSLDSGRQSLIKSLLIRKMGAAERDVNGVGRKSNVLDPASHPFHYLSENLDLLNELNRLSYKILGKKLSLDDLNNLIELRVGLSDVPYPNRFDDPSSYQKSMDSLPRLQEQGDGMRSLLGILIPLVTATFQIFIIDEPEAFLHPPQSFALGQELGRIAAERGVQVVLATHDRNLLAGLLNSNAPLSVVRLVRDDESTRAHQLRSDDLKAIWDDPVLKYSNVLDGLFHKLVVMAENERDCRFYEAGLDGRVEDDSSLVIQRVPLPATDVLFVPTGGTGGMSKVARALRALEVPVIASPDIDVLDNEAVIKGIVEALGHQWDDLHDDWVRTTQRLGGDQEYELVSNVFLRAKAEFERIIRSDGMARYDAVNRRIIKEALGISQRPWDEAKNYGVRVLERVSGDPQAVNRLLDNLAKRQVVLVHEGQLESFGYSLGIQKGKGWLPAALAAGLQSSAAVQAQIRRIIDAAEPVINR